ncbi:NAPDH-dependent diflavin reductase, partial [Tulasnella sp. 419]
ADHNLEYAPGDVAVLYPENAPEDVDTLSVRMGWTRMMDDEYIIKPTDAGWPLSREFPPRATLRQLLTQYLDISSVPRASFFQIIRHFATDEREKEKLEEFCTPEGQDELFAYCNRPRRTITEVLSEFRSVKVPLGYLLDVFPAIRPRQFSIASSCLTCPEGIQLCVAIVRYKSILKVPRKGLCTSWLARMSIGTRLTIRLESGTMVLPSDLSRPIILIGPGTGVAPMRAIIQDRNHKGAKNNLLYFGCRSARCDFHYEKEWTELSSKGNLILRLAASRDQEEKVYVQHLIPKDAVLLWDWIVSKEGSVFISGSSGPMPKSVRKAIIQALCVGGGWEEETSANYLREMELSDRWNEECWS